MNGLPGFLPNLGAVLAALALGIPCGVLANNVLAPDAPQATPRPSRPQDPEPAGDLEVVRRKLEDTNSELRLKVALVAELRAGKAQTRTLEQKAAAAKDLCDTYYRILKTGNKDEKLSLLSHWGELDPDMASFFVQRYRQSRLEPFSHVPLELALQCGGKDAGAFVEELLTGTLYTAEEKARVLRYVDGISPEEPIASFPVSDSLLEVAGQLTRSQNPADRKGAAGLLGMNGSPESSRALKAMAEFDSDPGVKAAAFRALGQTRDPKNLPYLEAMSRTWLTPPADGKPRPGQEEILRALRTSIHQLQPP